MSFREGFDPNMFPDWAYFLSQWQNTLTRLDEITETNESRISAVETLAQDLKQFVESYFEDLDVQEQINNKIDNMVQSGEFIGVIGNVVAEQTADSAAAWLAEHLTPSTSVVIDTSLSVSGAAADAKVTGGVLYGVNNRGGANVPFIPNTLTGQHTISRGQFAPSTGLKDNLVYRACTTRLTLYKSVSKISAYCPGFLIRMLTMYRPDPDSAWGTGNMTVLHNFDYFTVGEQHGFIDRCTDDGHHGFCLSFCRDLSSRTEIPTEDLTYIANNLQIYVEYVDGNAEFINTAMDSKRIGDVFGKTGITLLKKDFSAGLMNNDGTVSTAANRITTNEFIAAEPGKYTIHGLGELYEAVVRMFTDATASADNDPSQGASSAYIREGETFTVKEKRHYIRIMIARISRNNLTPDNIVKIDCVFTPEKSEIRHNAEQDTQIANIDNRLQNIENREYITDNYVVDGVGGKRKVTLVEVGTLSYGQSFCIYNGKFYSTNGSGAAIQSATFARETNKTVAWGHGNSFQLGHNGKAYVSGWNNGKFYSINLATLNIDSTITLPNPAGYNTGVIDDVNGIVYYFHRDSAPSSFGTYDFVAYDYVNNLELFRVKTSEQMRAMQACDLVGGRIYVLAGSGTVSDVKTNRFYVFNLRGEIVGKFVIPELDGVEPEGVAFNRDTDTMYISDANLKCYRVEY